MLDTEAWQLRCITRKSPQNPQKLKKRNDEGFQYADLIFSDDFEGGDLVNIDSIRDSIIPHFQKLGFDTYLFFGDNNDWDRSLCIAWEANVIPYMLSNDTNYWNGNCYNNNEPVRFPKTTNEYHSFDN